MTKRTEVIFQDGDTPWRSLRARLMACSALCLAGLSVSAVEAQTNCFADGTTLTCSTDHSGGILVDPFYDTLIVENLSADVGVDGGVDGIRFDNDGAITVEIDTGDFEIVGDGADAQAVHLSSFGGDHTVDLDLTGDARSSTSEAILATSAGDVDVTVTGDVTATLEAIRAQSFEGGDVSVNLTGTGLSYTAAGIFASGPGTVTVNVDGTLTANGDAIEASSFGVDPDGTVSVTANGAITSWNNNAISATSAHNGVIVTSTATLQAREAALAAISTSSGPTGTVTVGQTGNVTSDNGQGILARSSGGNVTITSDGTIRARLAGIEAVTTGNLTSATVAHTGNITSDTAAGITARSANGGVAVMMTGDITAKTDGINAETTAHDPLAALTVTSDGDIIAYDGRGIDATSSNGGVTVTGTGDITSAQDGIRANSTGNGEQSDVSVTHAGNILSYNGIGVTATASDQAVTVELTGDVTAKGSAILATSNGNDAAGTVSVTTAGGTLTSYDAYGIEARSSSANVTVVNSSAIVSDDDGIRATMTQTLAPGSMVSVTNTGSITSWDEYGIYATATEAGVIVTNHGALSVNRGGIYATATGDTDAATVTVTNHGDIAIFNGSGIFARSASEAVEVTHASGLLSGGSYGINAEASTLDVTVTVGETGRIAGMNTAAIRTRSITGTTITNLGTVDGGEYELAILTEGFGGTEVHNHGTLIGSFSLENGYSTLTNHLGGSIAARDLAFANGGDMRNDGIITPGGDGAVVTANFGANFVQGRTGVLRYDITDSAADRINVSGNVELEGGVFLMFDDRVAAREIVLMDSWWVDLGDLDLLNAAVAGEIRYTDTQVVLDYNGIDFAPAFLSNDVQSIGGRLNAAYDALSPQMDGLFDALIALSGDEAYEAAMDELTPGILGSATQQVELGRLDFSQSLMSCPAVSGEMYRSIGQSSCFWANASLTEAERNAGDPVSDFEATRDQAAFGVQRALDAGRFIGFAIGTSTGDLTDAAGDRSAVTATEIGASFKLVDGPLQLSAALSYATGELDTTRRVTIADIDQTLRASRDFDAVTLLLRAAHETGLGDRGYLRSGLDANITSLSYDAATETGGSAALAYDATNGTSYGVAPSVELGLFHQMNNGWTSNPFLRLGGFYYSGSADTGGDFALSEAAAGSFSVGGAEDLAGLSLSAGLNLVNGDRGALNLLYTHNVADDYDSGTVALRGMLRF